MTRVNKDMMVLFSNKTPVFHVIEMRRFLNSTKLKSTNLLNKYIYIIILIPSEKELVIYFVSNENKQFISSHFCVQDNSLIRLWFKQDNKFFLPKACVNFELTRQV